MISIVLAAAMLWSSALTAHAADGFPDAADDVWYREAMDFSSAKGLMVGTGDGILSPNAKLNRAMFVTVLHRLAGTPESQKESKFSDVPEQCYYRKAVDWAVENGVVFGTSETTFSPNRNITREEMACMIARYAEGIQAAFLNGPVVEQSFADQTTASAFAEEAVEVMRKTGLFLGNEEGKFYPREDATRAEAATVCMRLALKRNEVPAPAILKVYDENHPFADDAASVYPLSAEDTATLYLLLHDVNWKTGEYAEYIPTHSLTLWCGEYRFYLPKDAQRYDGVNYVNGEVYGGMQDPEGRILPKIQDIFSKYKK